MDHRSTSEADRLLLARVRRGAPDAWEEVIARFEGRLLAFANARLNDRAAAEDVVQETFLGFLVSLPNFDETSTPLESYLFAIAAHKLTDRLRRQGRRPAIPVSFNDSSAASAEPPGRARPASSLLRSGERRTREADVVAECLRGLIAQWLRRGDYERLKCLELLFVAGWSNKAVAQRLDIGEQRIANHKHFVITKLKEAATRARLEDFDPAEFGVSATR